MQIAIGQLDGIMYIFEDMELLQQGLTRIMQKHWNCLPLPSLHGLLGYVTKRLINPDQTLMDQIKTAIQTRLGRPMSLFDVSTGTWMKGYLKEHEWFKFSSSSRNPTPVVIAVKLYPFIPTAPFQASWTLYQRTGSQTDAWQTERGKWATDKWKSFYFLPPTPNLSQGLKMILS